MPVHLSMASASFLSAAPSRPRSLHRGDDAGGGAQRALDILHRAHCGSDQGRDARGNDVTDGVRAARHGAGERRQVLEVRPQRLDGPEIRDHRRAPLRRRRALAAPLTRTSTGFAGQTDFAATVTSQYASHFASTAHPPSSLPPVPVRRSKAPLHAPSHFTVHGRTGAPRAAASTLAVARAGTADAGRGRGAGPLAGAAATAVGLRSGAASRCILDGGSASP